MDPAVRVEQTWVLASQLRKVKGLPRYTKGLDVWVRPTAANARRVHRALKRFGAPLANLRVKDLHTPGIIFQIGVEPNRIDVLTELDAVDFDDAWARRAPGRLGRCEVAFLSVRDLIANKRRVARPQDLLDVEKLRAVAPSSSARPRQRKA
ncbi:MAG: hypothetical protein IT380_28995 [Myxococcales bacterium]|nr:hypothetical protein [Myxococcales bacterium]